jgi:hypothetical protein
MVKVMHMAKTILSFHLYVIKEAALSILEDWQEWYCNDSYRFIGGTFWHQSMPDRRAYKGAIKKIDIHPQNKEVYFHTSQMHSIQINQNGQPVGDWRLETEESASYRRILLLEERECIGEPPKITKLVNGNVYFPYNYAWIALSPKID